MFKGFKKEFQEQLEKSNRERNEFVFSLADLELIEKDGNRRKCRIISNELSEQLQEIYSQRKSGHIPQIKYIIFNYFHSSANS